MKIYELETANGRIFRVAIENENQLKRMNKATLDSRGKYEKIIRVDCILSGIESIKNFEKTAETFV